MAVTARRGLTAASAIVVLGVAACAGPAGVDTSPTESTTVADRTEACGTIQEARRDQLEPILGAMLVVGDETATPQDVAEAAQDLRLGLEALSDAMQTVAGQTTDAELQTAAAALATAAGEAAEAVIAAGDDVEQLAPVLETSGFADAEAAVLDLCRDVWLDQT